MNWTERSRTLDTYLSRRNILVCDDAKLASYPIRSAAHIVHYSLPNKLETFLKRFIISFGYYAEKLDRVLLKEPNQNELVQPVCVTYFDDNVSEDIIQIFDEISRRTKGDFPPILMNVIEVRHI